MSFVYVLTNKSMPGLVKVGMTARHPNERASELHSTGVPTPFEVAAIWRVRPEHLKKYERMAHKELEKFRVSSNREFFRIDTKKAIEILTRIIPTPEQVEPARIKREEEQRKLEAAQEVRREERAKLDIQKRKQAAIDRKSQVEYNLRLYRDRKEELTENIKNYRLTFGDLLERLTNLAVIFSLHATYWLVGIVVIGTWLNPKIGIQEKITGSAILIVGSPIINVVLAPMLGALFLGVSKLLFTVFGGSKPTKSKLRAELNQVTEKELALSEQLKALQRNM